MRHKLLSFAEMGGFSAPSAGGPDNNARRTFYKRIVAEAVRTQLTAKQREAVGLHYGQGLSIAQIAEELGVNPSSISHRIITAKKRIQRFAVSCIACSPRPEE